MSNGRIVELETKYKTFNDAVKDIYKEKFIIDSSNERAVSISQIVSIERI
jgi:hypothetical protein